MDHDSRVLIDWLRSTDAACPACGYSLRGLDTVTCPECGRALRLSVEADDTGVGGWLLGIVACAMAAGFDLVMVVVIWGIIATNGMPATGTGRFFVFAFTPSLLVPGLLCVAGMWLLWRRRRRFRRAPGSVQLKRGFWLLGLISGVHAAIGLAWAAWIF